MAQNTERFNTWESAEPGTANLNWTQTKSPQLMKSATPAKNHSWPQPTTL